jgi:hypothetical protein
MRGKIVFLILAFQIFGISLVPDLAVRRLRTPVNWGEIAHNYTRVLGIRYHALSFFFYEDAFCILRHWQKRGFISSDEESLRHFKNIATNFGVPEERVLAGLRSSSAFRELISEIVAQGVRRLVSEINVVDERARELIMDVPFSISFVLKELYFTCDDSKKRKLILDMIIERAKTEIQAGEFLLSLLKNREKDIPAALILTGLAQCNQISILKRLVDPKFQEALSSDIPVQDLYQAVLKLGNALLPKFDGIGDLVSWLQEEGRLVVMKKDHTFMYIFEIQPHPIFRGLSLIHFRISDEDKSQTVLWSEFQDMLANNLIWNLVAPQG